MKSFALVLIFFACSLWGADARIHAIDESGAPFPGVLVIVKSLENGRELGRHLTGADGRIPPVRFDKGLHRLILTCPYGICKTTVIEVLGQQVSTGDFKVEVPVKSTGEYGGVVTGEPELQISLLSQKSKPLAETEVLIRNADASRERWYRTDLGGNATVRVPGDPAVVVIIHGGGVYRCRLSGIYGSLGAPNSSVACHGTAGGQITLKISQR